MNIGAIIPFRDCDGTRFKARDRVVTHVQESLRSATVVIADDELEPFSRGGSIMRGIEMLAPADIDVFVVVDADLIVPGDQLRNAVTTAHRHPGLVVAFSRYLYLTAEQSASLEAVPYRALPTNPTAEWYHDGSVGGAGAFSRQTLELTGGFPPIFRGWGMEDVAFDVIAATLAGPTRRIIGKALHLWHPLDPTNDTEAPTYERNVDALGRIVECAGDPDRMRALLTELAAC